MARYRIFAAIALLVLVSATADAQCRLTSEISCPATLRPGQSGPCTLVSRNTGTGSCTGTVIIGMVAYDDAGTEQLARFTNVSGPLAQCISAIPELPDFDFPFAYCFGETSVAAGQTLTTSATLQVLKGPPSGVLQVAGFAAAYDENFEPVSDPEPAFTTVQVGTDACAPRVVAPSISEPGKLYKVSWNSLQNVTLYEVEESTNTDFANATRQTVPGTFAEFQHDASTSTAYYYRVRGIGACNQSVGPFSVPVRTVITSLPSPNSSQFELNTHLGSQEPIVFQIFIPHPTGKQVLQTNFTASTDKSFISVVPTSGTIPPTGTTLTVTADPKSLPPGGTTGTVNVTNSTTGQPIANMPVTVNLTAPVAAVGKNVPPPETLIIPAVAHVDGLQSRFQSDVRLSNVSTQPITYRLAFTPSGADGRQVGSQTSFTIDPGETVALNDILKNTFGLGLLSGERAGGSLEIRPLNQINIIGQTPGPSMVASSRTYAVTDNGTRGQFIPAIQFSEFVGAGSTLSLQNISESDQYRTNAGFVEGSGEPASLQVRVMSSTGQQLTVFPVELRPFEHHQFNRILRTQNITATDARLEVRVTSATGRIAAYASVLDNRTDDPQLVTAANTTSLSVDRYVIPGVKEFTNVVGGVPTSHTELRIYNGSTAPLQTTFTYYAQGATGSPRTAPVTIQPGETRTLIDPLNSLYGITNSQGLIVVSSTSSAPFVITARSYSQTADGTFGQSLPVFHPAKGTGIGERALQILQLEQSTLYQTTLTVFELSGNPVTAQIDAVLPDSKTATTMMVPLQGNEFKEIALRDLVGNSGAYNVRVSVRATDGSGRVGAFGSVIDAKTSDPTSVPAQ